MTRSGFVGLLATLAAGFCAVASADEIVPNTSTWRYLHPTNGVDPAKADEDFHSTFFTADFDDSKWKRGKDKKGPSGGFGYGDKGFRGVNIRQPKNKDHRKCAYFRLKFTADKEYGDLVFKCQRDDGIIVYLDGKEVLRDNVAGGSEAYDLFASQIVDADEEKEVKEFRLKEKLPAGEHILAVSLHNRSGGSSDLRIAEISLEGTPTESEPAESDDKKGADQGDAEEPT
jgi:hypothetical protein